MGWLKELWNKDKDGNRQEQRSFLRYAIVATSVMLLFLFVKKDNVFRWVEAGFTIRRQERQIEYLKQETDRLEEEARMLTNDPDTLERYAREQLGFAEPGDDVYLLK